MLNFLQSIFRSTSPGPALDARLVDAATERLLDGTDPRLRAVGGYRKRLREPIVRAVAHVVGLVDDDLPDPVEISAARFATDARLRAFFVSVDHLRETVSYSEDLQKFLQRPPALPTGTIHCLLTLDRVEKGVLGMALRGDAVSKDVAQLVVNFTGHRLVGLAPSVEEMRWELKKRAFDHLIGIALAQLTASREQSERLNRQRRLLERKLTAMQSGDFGMTGALDAGGGKVAAPEDLERELTAIEAELDTLPVDTATLESQLAGVAAALAEPERHLRVERTSLTLDPMGVRLDGQAAAGVPALELIELVSGDRRRVALPGFVIRSELLPPRDFLKEAQRRFAGGQ